MSTRTGTIPTQRARYGVAMSEAQIRDLDTKRDQRGRPSGRYRKPRALIFLDSSVLDLARREAGAR